MELLLGGGGHLWGRRERPHHRQPKLEPRSSITHWRGPCERYYSNILSTKCKICDNHDSGVTGGLSVKATYFKCCISKSKLQNISGMPPENHQAMNQTQSFVTQTGLENRREMNFHSSHSLFCPLHLKLRLRPWLSLSLLSVPGSVPRPVFL